MPSELTIEDQHAIALMADLARQADEVAKQFSFQSYQSLKSKATLQAQQRDFKLFKRLLQLDNSIDLFNKPICWQAVTGGLIEFFKTVALRDGYAISTINRVVATIRVYAGLAFKADYIDVDTYTRIREIKAISRNEAVNVDEKRDKTRESNEKVEANYLTPEECRVLKTPTSSKDTILPIDVRDTLMMVLLVDFGLRSSEVAMLNVGDVNLHDSTIEVYRKKTKTRQFLSFHQEHFPDVYNAIHWWMNADFNRDYIMDRGNTLLRASRRDGHLMDNPMTRITVSRRVRTLGKRRLGISNLSAHDLRHSFARNAIKSGADISKVMQSGGWESPEMLMRYVGKYRIANEGLSQVN